MSNRRRLKSPPTGWSYSKFLRILMESDMDEEIKRQIATRAAYADRKGRIPDGRYPAERPHGSG